MMCHNSPLCTQETSAVQCATCACELRTHAHDIACESYEEEDKICALVSSHVRPEADEDWGLRIGQLVYEDD